MYVYIRKEIQKERERERKRKGIFIFVKIHRFVQKHPHEYTHIGMGWLRLVGSLKVKVSNAKEPTKETIFCKRDL